MAKTVRKPRIAQPERLLNEITRRLNEMVRERQFGAISGNDFLARLASLEKAAGQLDKTRGQIARLRIEQGLQDAAVRREGGAIVPRGFRMGASRPPMLRRLLGSAFEKVGGEQLDPVQKAMRTGSEQGMRRATGLHRLGTAREAIRRRVGEVQIPSVIGTRSATEVPSIETQIKQLDRIAQPRKLAKAGRATIGAAEKLASRKGLMRGGIRGAAGLGGLALILKAIMGGGKEAEPGVSPEVQMQLMQMMGGGGKGVDPALSTGRELRNVFQLLQIIKTLRDMQAMTSQPAAGGLV